MRSTRGPHAGSPRGVLGNYTKQHEIKRVMDQSISHYHIIEKLGAGGMGEVYLARDTTLGRTVALKVLPAALASDSHWMKRFKQEARVASALNHPNVASIYEISEDSGVHFIAMEFVDGVTLRQQMKNTRLRMSEVIDIAIQIADALSAAHEAGIVHRDIKPENIMVRKRDGYVKVLDFGLAKLIERQISTVDTVEPTETLFQTKAGTIVGTVNYMSPEQARGLKVDARTDIWSFGVLLYEMIAGKKPFEEMTMVDSLASIIGREPVPLKQYAPEVPAGLNHIVVGALTKERNERHQSFQSVLSDLRALKKQSEYESVKLSSQPSVLEETAILNSLEQGVVKSAHQSESTAAWPSPKASGQKRQRARKSINSIAILPLVNESTDPELDYLSDGITESLIDILSLLPRLRVIARTTAFRYKGRDVSPQEVGNELDVQAVVTGRIRQFKENLTIKIELVDTSNGAHLWGEQYHRRFEDIFVFQEESAHEISEKLRLKLTSQVKKRLAKRPTESTEAYHLYLKGRYFWNKRTAEWMKKGIAHFQQALDCDPNYALAYCGLADSYISFATVGALSPQESCPKAKAAAIKALEIDGGLAEAQASLAMINSTYDWDWRESEKGFKRAIKLNPNYSIAHHWYGISLMSIRRFDESIAEMKIALQLDPLSPIINTAMGLPYYHLREYDRAVGLYQRVLDIDPSFFPAHVYLGLAYEAKMMYEEAISEFQQALSLSGESQFVMSKLGHAYAVSGEKDKAEQMLTRLNELAKQRYVSPYGIAEIYAGLRDKDQAFLWLEKSYQDRSWWLIFIAVNPRFDHLRSDSRFTGLVQRVGVPL